jgi:hypothetical protein
MCIAKVAFADPCTSTLTALPLGGHGHFFSLAKPQRRLLLGWLLASWQATPIL